MQFEFEGNRYRIVFGYDRDWNWAAHRTHRVEFRNPLTTGSDRRATAKGQPVLFCRECNLQLSHIAKAATKRLARCTLFVQEPGSPWNVDVAPVQPTDPSATRKAWLSMAGGTGRVNLEEGDQFSRRVGREAAMTDMLKNLTKERIGAVPDCAVGEAVRQYTAVTLKKFRTAAWTAYNTRKESGPFRKETGSSAL